MIKVSTYGASVLNDVLDIALGVNFFRRVCAVNSKFGVLCNFKRETLAVGDMPVESVDLSGLSVIAT
jgi:hypothetical protein